ncbi:MAG: aldose 1-epimerase [Prevotellaceae bacterium]|jgi:aldose 1-epimerase|nr:aldose 1-epimerase [Prevotellaceae bacterium]
MEIKKITWKNMEAVQLSAGDYEAILVPGVGANLVSLVNTAKNVAVLHTPTDADMETFLARPQLFGLPLLFPPNRIADGTYIFEGRKYQYPITIPAQNNYHHGIIKTQKFVVGKTAVGKDCVEVEAAFFSNAVNNEIFVDFPHEFECRMSFKLSANGLEHKVTFINHSGANMPLGVGYHTPINVPFVKGTDKNGYKIMLSVGKRWELSERTLPTEKLLDLVADENLLRTSGLNPVGAAMELALTNEPLKVDGKEYNGAILVHEASGTKVFYEVDSQVKHWTLWNNGGNAGYICPEPQTWAINTPNLNLPAEITGFQSLKPNAEWSSVSKLYVK